MRVEVLISCMYESDHSIIMRTNVQSDVVVINQCDNDKVEELCFENKKGEMCRGTFISTTERGLSKSRNMALKYATGDICLICDDDEVLEENYVDVIKASFNIYTESVLAFRINHPTRSFKDFSYKIGYFNLGTLGSWQITFKRKTILTNNIRFNEKMGSGTGNGAGEENRFLMDCYKKKLGIRYVPDLIGSIVPTGESQWFQGYTDKYWINRGWQSKMIYGKVMGYLHIWQSVIKNKKDKQNNLWSKVKWVHKGFNLKR